MNKLILLLLLSSIASAAPLVNPSDLNSASDFAFNSSITATTGTFTGAGGVTAILFSGPLTGNVTGSVSGSAGTVTGAVPTAQISLGTVAALSGATFTGASGITNAAFTATGSGGNIISASSITTTSGLFGATLSITAASYEGVSLSTQAAGTAGTLVTKTCPTGSFALSGGCSCSAGVATTAEVNMPNPTLTASGSMPTGWQCQQSGTTGGQCSVFVICSKIRF